MKAEYKAQWVDDRSEVVLRSVATWLLERSDLERWKLVECRMLGIAIKEGLAFIVSKV